MHFANRMQEIVKCEFSLIAYYHPASTPVILRDDFFKMPDYSMPCLVKSLSLKINITMLKMQIKIQWIIEYFGLSHPDLQNVRLK